MEWITNEEMEEVMEGWGKQRKIPVTNTTEMEDIVDFCRRPEERGKGWDKEFIIVCTGQHWVMVRYDIDSPGPRSMVIMETYGPTKQLEGTTDFRLKLEKKGCNTKRTATHVDTMYCDGHGNSPE